MKRLKIILLFVLLINTIGCTPQQKSESQNILPLDQIPQYEYSDSFFNYNFSQDEEGNCYFKAGQYFYQLNQQQQLVKLFDCLIDNKYLIYDIKYADDKFYCLVLKVNYDYDNAPLGIATIDIHGQNFQYLSDLIYSNVALPFNITNIRIHGQYIYILDLYNEESTVYIYSLVSQEIVDVCSENINEERYEFYKQIFPDFPYNNINHVYNNSFYQIIFQENNEKVFIQYNPINQTEKEYNITRYYNPNDQKIGLFYIDFVNNHWFLFSAKGIFMFDSHFENEKQLLDENIFENTYNIIPQENQIILTQ